MTLGILCSGQGGQHAGMSALIATLDTTSTAGADLRSWSRAPDLFVNDVAQPLICAWQCVLWDALAERVPRPSIVAGYSVGEVAAHACAGALSSDDAIALARDRAMAMSAASRAGDGLMAVRGLAIDEVVACCRATGAAIAIVNGDDRMVVGGTRAALDGFTEAAQRRGALVQGLPVTVAAHTPVLEEAGARFSERLQHAAWRGHVAPVVAGIDASLVRDRTGAIDTLARQVSSTVHWDRCMDAVREQGVQVCIELGPGQALARMMRNRHPAIETRSVDEFRSLDAVAEWVRQRAD